MKDYYLILNIEPSATIEEIKKAYRTMSLKYHPDKNQGDKYFEERFKDIQEAYEILSNINSRQEYDYMWMRRFKYEKHKPNENSNEPIRSIKAKDLDKSIPAFVNKRSNRGILFFLILTNLILLIFIIKQNTDNKREIDNLNSYIEFLKESNSKEENSLKDNISLLEYEIRNLKKNQTKTQKVESKPSFVPKESTKFSKNTYAVNVDDVKITSAEYEYGDWSLPNKRQLQSVSILNKTQATIKTVTVFYEVYSSNGTPINSELLTFNTDIKSDAAKKCRDFKHNYLDWIDNSDIVILTIKNYEF